jgi:hypothetical protein
MKYLLFMYMTVLLAGCGNAGSSGIPPLRFSEPVEIEVTGYSGDVMEPFLSRDGEILFFNNLNDPAINTNLHYAERTGPFSFQYKGEINGINTDFLEGVPSLDENLNFFCISTRSYETDRSTVYSGCYSGGSVSSAASLAELVPEDPGWAVFDAEISRDGQTIAFAEGRYDTDGGPYEADLFLAERHSAVFIREDGPGTFRNINTVHLEYAPCLSGDLLVLFFTRLELPVTPASEPVIMAAVRESADEPFGHPFPLDTLSGFSEAPALSPDGQSLYYHSRTEGLFRLYMVRLLID